MENIVQLAEELACRVGTLPSTYLGLPLSLGQNSSRAWEGIEDKFKRRLSAWKRQYISKGGRLTLINSTLSNLPMYLLSLFRMPKSVKGRLEKIQRDFLWGGGYNARKIHLVNSCSKLEHCQPGQEQGRVGHPKSRPFEHGFTGEVDLEILCGGEFYLEVMHLH